MADLDEVVDYKAAYEEEYSRRIQLEEDCELLACENLRLLEEVERLRKKVPPELKLSKELLSENFQLGDGKFANNEIQLVANACGGKNVIVTEFVNCSKSQQPLIVCGGADSKFYILDELSGVCLAEHLLPSPLLSIAVFGSLVVTGMMDGHVAIVRAQLVALFIFLLLAVPYFILFYFVLFYFVFLFFLLKLD